jgi:hypothetical protein
MATIYSNYQLWRFVLLIFLAFYVCVFFCFEVVLCYVYFAKCCLYLWVVHTWLRLRFSQTDIMQMLLGKFQTLSELMKNFQYINTIFFFFSSCLHQSECRLNHYRLLDVVNFERESYSLIYYNWICSETV